MLSCDADPSDGGDRTGYWVAYDCIVGRTGVLGGLGVISTISNSGVKHGMTCFHVLGKQPPGDGGGFDGV